MQNHSTSSNLAQRLQQKTQKDREQIESLISNELEILSNSLQQRSIDAMNTTEAAINQRSQQMLRNIEQTLNEHQAKSQSLKSALAKAWVKPAVIGFCLCAGIFAASWGVMLILSQNIESQLNQLNQLSQQIESQTQQLAKIESKTWGLTYRETADGRWIEIPKGYDLKAGWTAGEKKVVKFGKE